MCTILYLTGPRLLALLELNKHNTDIDNLLWNFLLSPSEMKVVKIGGPVYRIGVGGGAASSIEVQGDNAEDLDFGAVQRGDAEMEQKLNRVIRACIEMGDANPICSIHDQGAGGNGRYKRVRYQYFMNVGEWKTKLIIIWFVCMHTKFALF